MNRSGQNFYRNPKVYNLPFEQPKKKRSIKIYKPILVILLLLGIYYFFFKSSVFQIKNITIDENLPPEVSIYMNKYLGKNIFTFRSSEIRDDLLSKYPELSNITVLRGIPDSLKVTFIERDPKIVWQSGLDYYLVDSNGIAFKAVGNSNGLVTVKDNHSLPVKIEQPVASTSFINFVTGIKSKLDENNFKLDHFEVDETTFQVDAVLDTGLKLKFDITRSVDEQISDLTIFWRDHASEPTNYVDLRVAGKVFYK